MGKVALYALAAFMETGIGIWLFGQVFPQRERLEKRHVFGEWALFAVITACAYSLPKTLWGIENERCYIKTLIILHLSFVIIYGTIMHFKKQLGKKLYLLVQGSLLVGIIVCLTAQSWISYQSYQMALTGNLFPVLFLWIFYKCSFSQAYLWEFAYATNLGMLKNVYITYVGAFEGKNFENFFYWPRSHTYKEAIYLLIICFLVILINKYIPLKNIISQILNKHKKAIFFLTFVEWLMLLAIIENGFGQIKGVNLTASLILALMIVFCLTLLYIKSIIKIASTEKNIFNMRTKAMEDQYKELNVAYEKYRCVVHDEKHMLLYIQECLSQNDVEAAKKFLNNYQQELRHNGSYSQTGIATLDFLLNIKKPQMDKASIVFRLDCQIEYIILKESDFIVILGNLLDNAIEAAEKCEKEHREIYLSLKNINDMFYLIIRNSCKSEPHQKGYRFLTTKDNFKEHGWGIESVKHTVEKYGGNISFQYSEIFFEAKVII